MDADITVVSADRLNYVAHNVPDVNLFDLPADERKCPICLKPYVQEEPRKPYSEREEEGAGMLRCGHVFGQGCLEDWIIEEGGNTCPVCRAVIYDGNDTDSDLDSDDWDDDYEGSLLRLEQREEMTALFSDSDGDGDEDGEEQTGGNINYQSDDEMYYQSSENGEEEEYSTFVAGLEKGQRTIDGSFEPLKEPPVEAKQET